MMSMARLTATDHAGLCSDKFQMGAIAQAFRFRPFQLALVDRGTNGSWICRKGNRPGHAVSAVKAANRIPARVGRRLNAAAIEGKPKGIAKGGKRPLGGIGLGGLGGELMGLAGGKSGGFARS